MAAAAAEWNAETWAYLISGEEVEEIVAKGGSAGIANEFNARIRIASQRLQDGTIEVGEWYEEMKRETKLLHMAEYALSRGGISQVEDWTPVEEIVAEQWNGNDDFPGLRAFAEDIVRGRYGAGRLSQALLSRSAQYADAGRLTYENGRLRGRMEAQEIECRRVLGFLDHCEECRAWAALGWIPAQVMYAHYRIGMSRCGANCWCILQSRRVADETAQGWSALGGAVRAAAQIAGGLTAAAAALAILRNRRASPALVLWILKRLGAVLAG
jgi:hypothetical protein